MIAGLFVGAVLCAAEPETPKLTPPAAPGMSEAHRDALARFGAAVWNLRRERLLTAAKQLEGVAKADPDAVEPLKELARLYAQLGREVEAIRVAQKALQKDPTDHETAILLARLLADAGELKDAVAAAKLAIESKTLPETPAKAVRAYRDLAALCEKAKDLAAAETALGKAVELLVDQRADVIAALAFTPKEADSEAADCLERLGRVRVKRGSFDTAAEAFEAAAKLYGDPKKADDPASAARLSWNLSGALEGKGEPAAAIKHLEQFLKLQPRAVEPYRRYARLLRAAGREDEVVTRLGWYAERDKTNRPLTAVLLAEMASDPLTRGVADGQFALLTKDTAEPEVIAVVVRSHLETRRAVEIIKDLDRAFLVLKEDNKGPKEPDTPAKAAAKTFAGEKARAYADALENELDGVAALLRAAGDDLKSGAKRAHGTYYFLGALAARHHKLDLAALQFRQAARLAPFGAQGEAYRALLDVLRRAGKPVEIEAVCLDALAAPELSGFAVLFNFYLALALAEQGKEKAALTAADKAIQQAGADDRLTVRIRRHTVLCVLGRWGDAIEYGKKLSDEFDAPAERARVRYAQSGAYWGAKKPVEAEALLRAILDDDPDNASACNDLGYHLADQGRNLDEAERLVRHALAVDRIDRKKAGSAEPETAAYRDSLGWVLFRQGKLAEARIELEKAAALAAGEVDPVVWDHLGDVLFRLGAKPKAKSAWEKAKELYEADARISSRGRRDGRLDEVKRKLARVR
jgi:tetratricopeptide (TPR) repeat protein